MPVFYVVDAETKVVNGPFATVKDTIDEVSNLDEDEFETRFVLEISEAGEASIEGAEEWYDTNSEDDDD